MRPRRLRISSNTVSIKVASTSTITPYVRAGHGTRRVGHGQQPSLWDCASRAQADPGPAHPAQAREQPSGEFACAREAARTETARVQVAPVRPAVLVPTRGHLQHLHRSPSPHHCSHLPPLPSRGVQGMAECGWYRRLTWAHAQLLAATFDKLTKLPRA